MKWKDYLDDNLTQFKYTSPESVQKLIGEWLGRVRMQGLEPVLHQPGMMLVLHQPGMTLVFTSARYHTSFYVTQV